MFCGETGASDASSASLSRDLDVRSVNSVGLSILLLSSTALSVDMSGCSASIVTNGMLDGGPPFLGTPVTTYSDSSGSMSAGELAVCIADIGALSPVCP